MVAFAVLFLLLILVLNFGFSAFVSYRLSLEGHSLWRECASFDISFWDDDSFQSFQLYSLG